MTFTISQHAEKQARKRFKWRLPSLIKEAAQALESDVNGTCEKGRFFIWKGITFIFKGTTLVTLYKPSKQQQYQQ
jgi:hypothetical protein